MKLRIPRRIKDAPPAEEEDSDQSDSDEEQDKDKNLPVPVVSSKLSTVSEFLTQSCEIRNAK